MMELKGGSVVENWWGGGKYQDDRALEDLSEDSGLMAPRSGTLSPKLPIRAPNGLSLTQTPSLSSTVLQHFYTGAPASKEY